ncbi:MAG TPA: hypothetical protein VLQ46_06765, partial [Casimicrobiaceae bacterium]|nr:hypothetical protein [Casimicrobiaceae bacterium]
MAVRMLNSRALAGLRAAVVLIPTFVTAAAGAQQPTQAQANAIRQACRNDYMAHCSGVPTGGAAALDCLKQNAAQTSPQCQKALRAVSGAAAPAAAAAAPPAATAAAPVTRTAPSAAAADVWPHTIERSDGSATVYQPQVVSWPEFRTLNARMVLGVQPTGAKAATLGTIEVTFSTAVDRSQRVVVLTDPKLVSANFPMFDAARLSALEDKIRAALAEMSVKRVPIAMVTASLRSQVDKPPEVPLDNTPPKIFASTRPASLVVFDGEPVLAPIAGTTLSYAVNTNWDVFSDSASKRWFLLYNSGWLSAPDAKGPWRPAGTLPAAFSALPADANFADVKKQIPGLRIAERDAPAVFVSTGPAAIIVTNGPPRWTKITGTSLQYASNTDAALFRDTATDRLYYLLSGRWFSAATLEGPWAFATAVLPADFARIPASGPVGFVLPSVPGTPQAQEAVLEAQVPQQATLSRDTAKLTVVYGGAPQFVPIAGTSLAYATNTSFAVIQSTEGYFSCYQGAWFAAPAPAGPWVLATSVPQVIYTVPPSSPVYPCTYVRVYTSTPTTVTYGYTSGYTMSYVSAGVIVYGTGYHYPPYIYPAPIPIYYPYPYTYAAASYYNPTTGAWGYRGAVYGPYGGVARGGTYYNPTTGAWAHGGAIYGPNGGAGAFSAYNPTTGSYAHGSAVWGPDGASANASWYNANTGRSVTTQQNANAYGRWGSSTITTPTQTIHTQSQSGARGSEGSFSSSTGAEGAGARGAGGNSAGAVKTASGQVYAGADGNVYKKTNDGWQKYDNGSWNTVNKSTAEQQRTASSSSATGAAQS